MPSVSRYSASTNSSAHGFLAEQHGDQRARIRVRQASERYSRRQALAIPVDQRGRERMRSVELDLAVRREDEHAIVAQVAQHIVQQRQGPLVRPMDVVDEHEQAAVRGERLQEPADVVEQSKPLFAGRQRGVGDERAELRFDFGRELGHFHRGRPQLGAQLFDTLSVHPLAQRLDERQIRRGRFVLVATAAQNRCAALAGMRDQFLREPRLAHARLAGQQDQMPARLLRLVPVLLQMCELDGASDELAAYQFVQRRAGCAPHVLDAQRREL